MSMLEAIHGKFVSPLLVERLCEELRLCGETIVFTNGCFDVIHLGHIELLTHARTLGTKLFVGLNSDSSVKRLKGPNRPIFNMDVRVRVLEALIPVSFVTVFMEDTPLELIHEVRPHVLVKGGDWAEHIVGSDFVTSYGGKVVVFPYIHGYSTSKILEHK